MPVIAFNHYNLRAPRDMMEALRAFYCDVVGLAAGERPSFDSFGYWLYAGGQPVLHLSEARQDAAGSFDGASTFDHAAFSCSDLAGFERRLTERGVKYRVGRVPLTGQVQLFLKDPAGNGVELNFADEA